MAAAVTIRNWAVASAPSQGPFPGVLAEQGPNTGSRVVCELPLELYGAELRGEEPCIKQDVRPERN